MRWHQCVAPRLTADLVIRSHLANHATGFHGQIVMLGSSRSTVDMLVAQLPVGVAVRVLPCAPDDHSTTALYRLDWDVGRDPVQWNIVSSRADTLRGVHVHLAHSDYLCVVRGEMLLGLHDMRPASPTYRLTVHQRLRGDQPCSVVIPPGVAHGFYFPSSATHIYAVSHYWNPADELGCRWDDAELGLSWPTTNPLLSARDASAPSYRELARVLTANPEQHAIQS